MHGSFTSTLVTYHGGFRLFRIENIFLTPHENLSGTQWLIAGTGKGRKGATSLWDGPLRLSVSSAAKSIPWPNYFAARLKHPEPTPIYIHILHRRSALRLRRTFAEALPTYPCPGWTASVLPLPSYGCVSIYVYTDDIDMSIRTSVGIKYVKDAQQNGILYEGKSASGLKDIKNKLREMAKMVCFRRGMCHYLFLDLQRVKTFSNSNSFSSSFFLIILS